MSLLDNIKKGPSTRPPKIMLIGQEGVGKSTAGAQMPNPVFICGESGLVGPQFAGVANFTPSNWSEVLQFVDELATNRGEFETLVIDTLDWLEPMLYQHVVTAAKKKDIKHIEDFGYGKGYVIAQNEARQLLVRLDKANAAGMNILLLSHSQLKTVKNPTGEDYDHFESKMNAKISGLFKEWSDAVLFARFEVFVEKNGIKVKATGGTSRIVQTTHSAAWDAKNRFGLPDVMDLDMPEILKAIRGEKDETPELVAELEGLIPHLPDDKKASTEKWLSRKKFTAVDLRKVINNCKKIINEKEADNA